MLMKYRKHLLKVEESIIKYVDNQVRYISSLESAGPERYKDVIFNTRSKVAEANIKLSYIRPNIDGITKQVHMLIKEHNLESLDWVPVEDNA